MVLLLHLQSKPLCQFRASGSSVKLQLVLLGEPGPALKGPCCLALGIKISPGEQLGGCRVAPPRWGLGWAGGRQGWDVMRGWTLAMRQYSTSGEHSRVDAVPPALCPRCRKLQPRGLKRLIQRQLQ